MQVGHSRAEGPPGGDKERREIYLCLSSFCNGRHVEELSSVELHAAEQNHCNWVSFLLDDLQYVLHPQGLFPLRQIQCKLHSMTVKSMARHIHECLFYIKQWKVSHANDLQKSEDFWEQH